jgi:DNA-binding beta-propeller fold protein YncE
MTLFSAASTWGQTVVATVATKDEPFAVAVNSATNKIYVAAGNSWTQVGTIAVIDGATNSTTTVKAGIRPYALAVNPTTNKTYVANRGCAGPFGCGFPGSITVLDGANNSTTTIVDPNANGPSAVAVNSTTNTIYVANFWTGNVTVIDGATNSFVSVTDPNAKGMESVAVAINPVSDKIYVVNNNKAGFSNTTAGNVTIIDGATNSTTTVTDPNAKAPIAVAINPGTDKIYVANEGAYPTPNHGNVTVIDGATNFTTTVTDSSSLAPVAIVVNPATNKIYVANLNDSSGSGNGGVTVIDGATNALTTVRDPNAIAPTAVAVDPVTNKIYVANYGIDRFESGANPNVPGSVTVIDGVTNSTTTVVDPNATNPIAISIDPAADRIYVANINSSNLTVIDGGGGPLPGFTLSVADTGSGSGTVTSNPSGINCGSTCSASFDQGTSVELSASPSSGSTFSGWGGACSGSGSCMVTVSAAVSVTATFTASASPDFSLTAAPTTLTVQPGSKATDTVTVTPENGPFSSAIQLSCSVTGPLANAGLRPASKLLDPPK